MTNTYNDPEFYVSESGYELVDRSANYLLIRNGEMRIHDNRPEYAGNVYRYTDQLFDAGITEGNLWQLINDEQIEVIHNPWFEVWGSETGVDPEFESEAIHELIEAERYLAELESEVI